MTFELIVGDAILKNAVFLLLVITSALAETPPSRSSLRLTELVGRANITAVHAYQMLLARKQPNMDKTCWPSTPPDVDLESSSLTRPLC